MLDALLYALDNSGLISAALLVVVAVLWYFDLRKIDRLNRELAARSEPGELLFEEELPEPRTERLASTMASASAAELFNCVLPQLEGLPASGAHARLRGHLLALLLAYDDFRNNGLPQEATP